MSLGWSSNGPREQDKEGFIYSLMSIHFQIVSQSMSRKMRNINKMAHLRTFVGRKCVIYQMFQAIFVIFGR